MKQKRNFIVLSGIPGTGKSTLRKNLETVVPNLFVYSTDDLIDDYARKNNKTYSEVWEEYVSEATSIANNDIQDAIRNGKNIIIDKTNLTPKSRKKFISQLSPKDWNFQCIQIIKPQSSEDLDILKERLRIRGEKEGKIINEELLKVFIRDFTLVTEEEVFSDYIILDMYGQTFKTHQNNVSHKM